ncbi:MAG: hypothetical protein KVP17_003027 [Porospora cf. gigantea B]|uniref:uncharacterized protein n=1 Tax=Porospora cf. gigantea B TaxID=2853592 RepID=UPI003571A3FA|nr:MAG: hypothetical protein KVP17_003027 [Porospora cf. gigantea B]
MDKSSAERYWLLASSGEEGPREGALAMLKAKLTKLNIVKESNVLDVPTNLTYGTFDDLIRLADDIQKQDYYCEAVLRRLERQGLELDPNSQFVIVQQRKSSGSCRMITQ